MVGVSDGMGVVEAGAERRRARGWAEAGAARPRHAAFGFWASELRAPGRFWALQLLSLIHVMPRN